MKSEHVIRPRSSLSETSSWPVRLLVVAWLGSSACALETEGIYECEKGPGVCLEVEGEERCYCPERTLAEGASVLRTRIEAADANGSAQVAVLTHRRRDTRTELSVFRTGESGLSPTGSAIDLSFATFVYDVLLGDLDGDGFGDVFITTAGGDDNRGEWFEPTEVRVFVSRADGSFNPAFTMPWPYTGGGAYPAMGDVDGDGRLDVVLARNDETTDYASIIETWRGRGDGTFDEPSRQDVGDFFFNQVTPADLLDVDGDGSDDLVVAGALFFPFEPGNGRFGGVRSTGLPPGGAGFASDGTHRAVGVETCDCDVGTRRRVVARLQADGEAIVFWSREYAWGADHPGMTWVDLEGDGIQELLVQQPSRTMAVLPAREPGEVFIPGSRVPEGWTFVGSVDANADGRPDLLVRQQPDESMPASLVVLTAQGE